MFELNMARLLVLFEHAAGFGLFSVREFEEVGMLLPQVEASVSELKRFNQIVKLTAFQPFKSAVSALENINSLSEGIVSDDLQAFLEQYFPKVSSSTLGVGDNKLASAISDGLGIMCQCTGAVPEIIRGIRLHFDYMVKGFTKKSSDVAQLGLGHSYSRAKVKFNVNRVDNMIIQSISLLDMLDKDINTFSMRIREWYSYHFPELFKMVPDNHTYAKLVNFIGNRKELTEDSVVQLEEITKDRDKAEAILDASRSSMGMDISPVDLMNIQLFAKRVVSLANYRQSLTTYLHNKMAAVAPNTATLLGDQVGARLISQAGSLTNLAKLPASTVQILGAEKALFRALKSRSNLTPKYGLLYHSSFIARAEAKNKGRISRFLANKCSIASRIDCFSENPSTVFGEKLKEQVEDRLKFFTTGEKPRKNIDVMKEAVLEAAEYEAQMLKKQKRKDRKKRKAEERGELDTTDGLDMTSRETEAILDEPIEKKKSKTSNAEQIIADTTEISKERAKKKKKKRGAPDAFIEPNELGEIEEDFSKKNKKKTAIQVSIPSTALESITGGPTKKIKKFIAPGAERDAFTEPVVLGEIKVSSPKKKKKKPCTPIEVSIPATALESLSEKSAKKKKAATPGSKLVGFVEHNKLGKIDDGSPKKKKKKSHSAIEVSIPATALENLPTVPQTIKRKKSKSFNTEPGSSNEPYEIDKTEEFSPKKKKKKTHEVSIPAAALEFLSGEHQKKRKKET